MMTLIQPSVFGASCQLRNMKKITMLSSDVMLQHVSCIACIYSDVTYVVQCSVCVLVPPVCAHVL